MLKNSFKESFLKKEEKSTTKNRKNENKREKNILKKERKKDTIKAEGNSVNFPLFDFLYMIFRTEIFRTTCSILF